MTSNYDDEEYYVEERPRKKKPSGNGQRRPAGSAPSGQHRKKRPAGSAPTGTRTRTNGASSHKKGTNSKKKKKGGKRALRIIIFLAEIVALVAVIGILYVVTRVEKVGKVDIKEEDIEVNAAVETNEEMKGYRTIALFGVDSRTGALTKNTRTDTIILANINLDDHTVKLVSVYRDTYLNIGNDTYNKANSAYAKGGPQQALNMLNTNMDLNITDFVTVGFEGLSSVINALGGVYIDVQPEEISFLNDYQYCIAEDLKTTYTPVTSAGYQKLDGIQATAYCRIRYTRGDDFRRAERQRNVLNAIMDTAKTSDFAKLTAAANAVFDGKMVYTSMDLTELLDIAKDISSYSIIGDDGFPNESMRTTGTLGSVGSSVIAKDIESNVVWLHGFLFGEENYEPSSDVKKISQEASSKVATYLGQ
ncbi:MAG: LCP family protein [Lachnospiraceae bacterium]|nr:LCP family protein [Lachnospiraceae bacterium]